MTLGMAGPYTDLKGRLSQAQSDADVIRIVRADPRASAQTDIKSELSDLDDQQSDYATTAKELRTMVDLGSIGERDSNSDSKSSLDQRDAQEVKRAPFYRDPGFDRKRNWLADALERLKNIRRKENRQEEKMSGPGLFGPIFTYLMWAVLAALVATLLYFAIKHVNWQRALTRKAKALLEDDEPDRTLDEWLVLADEHTAAGRFREAVRALYLACLLRFDEGDVARFHRGETNWEHLARIEASPKLPAGLDFREPTNRFDRIWYGYQTQGLPDVEQFRVWYQDISELLRRIPK